MGTLPLWAEGVGVFDDLLSGHEEDITISAYGGTLGHRDPTFVDVVPITVPPFLLVIHMDSQKKMYILYKDNR